VLIVTDAPKITCHFASAYLDDDDANIRCAIMSNPRVLNFYWTIGTNGTYLSEAETLSEYRTTAKVHSNFSIEIYHFHLQRFIMSSHHLRAVLSCDTCHQLLPSVVGIYLLGWYTCQPVSLFNFTINSLSPVTPDLFHTVGCSVV